MTRVAMVMAGARLGGAETFFVRLCAALHRAGEELLAVIRTDPDRAALLGQAGIDPVQLRFGGPLDLLTRPRLGAALHHFAPNVVVSWMNRAASRTQAGPWVRVGRLGGYYDLKHYRGFDHLVGNTLGIERWVVEQGWPRDRAHHLPNFVPDLAAAPPADRGPLGVPDGARLLLAMGRLHRNKGFDTLIDAMKQLPDMHAVIAGEGDERAALTDQARRLGVAGRVHLVGWRTDQASLLAAADLFVCSSRHEPLGNIVLEAWSAGRAVVAAASQGPGELIEAGRTGVLVPAEDPSALAEAIAGLLDDPARALRLAQAGRAAWRDRFAEASVVTQWRDFLASVAR